MASLAFILGVFPLAVATAAGAEMRQSLGTAVFSGMLGVTVFGLAFTPAFYTFIRVPGATPGAAPPSNGRGKSLKVITGQRSRNARRFCRLF